MRRLAGSLHIDLKILDVGARPEDGGHTYQPLIDRFPCEIIGFDPDPQVCAAFTDEARGIRCLPAFVGDGTEQTFYVLPRHPNSSSLYLPNAALIRHFPGLTDLLSIMPETVRTTRLDDVPQARGPDFVKLDVQGAELQVLQGGVETLASASVVQTEVEFVPMYQGQPLFAEIDQEMRRQGFLFHKFRSFGSRPVFPVAADGDVNRGI